MDHKTLQIGDLWKSTFVTETQRLCWIQSLEAYMEHYTSQEQSALEAWNLARAMTLALKKNLDTRAVDLWLAGADRGLFRHMPPPPLRLSPEQSRDHFTEEHRRLLDLGQRDLSEWESGRSNQSLWDSLPDWAKKGLH